jgi:hypothetical protein
VYNTKKMDDVTSCLAYRELLSLTARQSKHFKGILEGVNAPPKYVPEDWD